MKTPKRLNKDQRLALLDLIAEVNSEDCTSITDALDQLDNAKLEFVLDWPIFSAGENMPGYMPDSPYCLFHTDRAARGHCRELENESGHKDGGYVCDIIPTTLRDVLPNSSPTIRCDSCCATMINGVFCHETGCPNSGKTWIADRGEFVQFVKCFNCGFEVEAGTPCDCQDANDTDESNEPDTVTLPTHWTSALINGDYSGMTDDETARCTAAEAELAEQGFRIVSDVEGSDRFTWSYRLYDKNADCSGGNVTDYVSLKA